MWLLLLACQTTHEAPASRQVEATAAPAPIAPATAPVAPPPAAPTPKPPCDPSPTAEGLPPGWRPATPTDLHPAARELQDGCTAVRAELTGDAAPDRALLAIDIASQRSAVWFVVDGAATQAVSLPPGPEGKVYTTLSYLPTGSWFGTESSPGGPSQTTAPGILRCMAAPATEAGLPKRYDDSSLCYCTQLLVWERGKIKTLEACD